MIGLASTLLFHAPRTQPALFPLIAGGGANRLIEVLLNTAIAASVSAIAVTQSAEDINSRTMFNNAPGGANMANTILRLPAVLLERGRSRSAHYLDIQQGLFTRPVSIGARAVGWPEPEVAAINAARIAGMTPDEIRVLVAKLEAARKAVC